MIARILVRQSERSFLKLACLKNSRTFDHQKRLLSSKENEYYDVVVCGNGIVGAAMVHAICNSYN